MAKKEAKAIPTTLEGLKNLCDKDYGDGTIMIGRGAIIAVDVFPTGVATIDKALGVGGLPLGRTMELFGTESSGKTTTCLQFIAACQQYYFPKKKRNGVAAFIDAEHAFDPIWAEKIGVDMDTLIMSQPGSGEEALQIAEIMAKSKLVDLVVIDSVAALTPKAELMGEIGDHHVGAQARMMSQAMRKMVAVTSKSGCTIIFINQIREKIGVMFGNPEVTPGGRALKFYTSIRAQISKGSAIKDGDVTIGFRPKIKFIKNKVAAPFTSAEYDICVGHSTRPIHGIDVIASLLDAGLDEKIITKKGNFYWFGKENLGNGRNRALKLLRAEEKLTAELKKQIYDGLFSHTSKEDCIPERQNTSEKDSIPGDIDLSEIIEDE